MTRDGRVGNRTRFFELALAAAAAAIIWAAARYGPGLPPDRQEPRQAQVAPPSGRQVVSHEDAPRPAGDAEAAAATFDGAVLEGHTDVGVREFTERLESLYRGRGYVRRRRDPVAAIESGGRDRKVEKFYWRGTLPDAELILARGSDANPHTEEALGRPDVFLTTVTRAEGGGAHWSTYRYGFGEELSAALDSGADFPGGDPPLVPRAPGTRRLLSLPQAASGSFLAIYTSGRPAPELADWYQGEMSKTWSYDRLATSQARQVADGTFCFTRPRAFCLLWLTPEADGRTTLVVSLRRGSG